MKRSVIDKLLQAVPAEDLVGLKSICVRTVPHKKEKKWDRIRKNFGTVAKQLRHFSAKEVYVGAIPARASF